MNSTERPRTRSLDSCFTTFTGPNVIRIAGTVVAIPRHAKRNRASLFAYLDAFPEETKNEIRAAALKESGTKRKGKNTSDGPRKRRRVQGELNAQTENDHRVPTPTPEPEPEPMDVDADLLTGPFFASPTKETVENCISNILDRTGNEALHKELCMVCARCLFITELEEMGVEDIPNKRHLIPIYSHPAHELTGQWLLHPAALDQQKTFVCTECLNRLTKDERPRLALSNGMWVGPVPFELEVLTLPERLLVALYFPAAYVVKLFPKTPGAIYWDKNTMNSGMKGNVSTYKLNTAQIAGIMSGNIMPPSPQILAATIGVTFVGAKNVPLKVLPDFLRVRRQRVFEALLWLKANNGLYRLIEISQEQLQLLPVNAVPDEISMNTKYSDDVGALEREQAGYVPMDVEDEQPADVTMGEIGGRSGVNPVQDDEDNQLTFEPAAFPLQAMGVVDAHAEGVPDNDILAHALANTADERRNKDFMIRRGSAFINEYPRLDENRQRTDGGPSDPNHMLGAFPVLFPYGKGGLEVGRAEDVPYEAHVRWALQYADGRFRKDLYFIFQAFGVIQKRQVCRSAGLQIKRKAFIQNQTSFLKLTPHDLIKASAEETRRVQFSNPVVRKLRQQVRSVRARVQGTDESRVAIRSQVWGMNLRFNPPSIWATLNLADTDDPIAQVLAGEDIDMDKFLKTAGPDRATRATNVASDPMAAAEFFHYTVKVILEEAFGIKVNRTGRITREEGIVGIVNGYIGTVEAQARGTLHLHIMFWLKGAPSSKTMRAALLTEAFRDRMIQFIQRTIRADIKGADAAGVLAMKKVSSVAYSRPEDPRLPNYELRAHEAEASIARTVQVHSCTINTCLKNRGGRLVCKRRAPWPLSSEDWVLPSGEWGPRRVFGRLNAWNPPLLQVTRSNQDMKLITNGHETKDITFYITLYIAKKQIQASNASALLAKSLAFHKKANRKDATCRDINKRMITQCANTLSRQHEFSGPEVVSYLMGWDDRFVSHNFVPIYWDEVSAALKRAFPALAEKSFIHTAATALGVIPPQEAQHLTEQNDAVRIRVVDGVFVLKDQLKEYTDRGHELDSMNFHDYFVETYDGPLRPDQPPPVDGELRPGRPASQRVPYLPEAKRKRCRVRRGPAYETVLQFIGDWFPRSSGPTREFYCASVLVLLVPWRNIAVLKAGFDTFDEAFTAFMQGASSRVEQIVHNIDYFHECSDGSKKRKEVTYQKSGGFVDLNDHIRRDAELEELNALQLDLTEADVQAARDNRYPAREYAYGERAMNVAYEMGIFDDDGEGCGTGEICTQATLDEMVQYQEWAKKLSKMTRTSELVPSNNVDGPGKDADKEDAECGPPRPFEPNVVDDERGTSTLRRNEEQQEAIDKLNAEQRRAHDIIEAHLRREIDGVVQDQLLMIVRGEGGTGKTVLLTALSHTFEYLQQAAALAKTATTGVAASLLGGQTVHSWASINPMGKDTDDWIERAGQDTVVKRKNNILGTKYLTIDEYSMLTKKLLCQLSQVIGATRATVNDGDPSKPFGGMNVILFGDLHQFPPVAHAKSALYCPDGKKPADELGLEIYRQFTTVVTLTQQMRIIDLPWMHLLQRLREGACTEADLDEVKKLLVTDPRCDVPDWHSAPWNTCVLVTPRHGARMRWNTASVQRHSRLTGNRMYICKAEDRRAVVEEELNLEERVLVAGMVIKKTGKLAEHVELCVGMRAMVLTNIATEKDLANGTRGVVVDIKLDPREPTELEIDTQTGATMLNYPPALVLFKPDRSTFPRFEGLPPGVLPIVPSRMGFNVILDNGAQRLIHRRQLALTPAYAFTDYKAQGQTIEYVLVDLEPPPSYELTPFSAYVALSRSKGRQRIRLLRGFNPKLFTTHPSEDLAVEDARLNALNSITQSTYP